MLVVSPLQSQPLAVGDIPTQVFRSAEPYRDDVVLVDAQTDQTFTIGDIITTSTRLAAGLARCGNGGRVISVFDDTQLRCVYVYYAALMIGGTYQSLGTDISDSELAERIRQTESPVVFTTSAYLDKLNAATKEMRVCVHVLDSLCSPGASSGCRCLSFCHLLFDDPSFVPVRITSKDDAMRKAAYLAYSPIGQHHKASHQLMLSHYGLLSSQRLSRPPQADSALRTAVSVVPFSNTHGISNIAHFPMLSGSRVVQLNSNDPVSCLAAMQKWKAGVFLATFSALSAIVSRARRQNGLVVIDNRRFDVGPLQVIFMHELRMPAEFKEKVSDLLLSRIVELYGYIETGLISGMITEYPRIANSVGVLCPNVSARVVLDGREVDEGQFGEILVSTPRLTLANSVAMADGANYFRTGDYGRVTAEGVVIIKARMDDLLYTASGIVAPADIESELLKNPAVTECAAVAMQKNGVDVPFVFVVAAAVSCSDAHSSAGDGAATSVSAMPTIAAQPATSTTTGCCYSCRSQQGISEIVSPLCGLYSEISGCFIESIPKSSRGGPDRALLRSLLISDNPFTIS
ncbi:4-coumarate--CoA ligase [Coemansia sp. RSA 1722]|nr:4-coumarate--CoA ligase [Coemansia sp. RSA 486]KAJ2232919.1 4-coumarate--CoA ligase [Coemansia sp. RSA 485]KAJ2599848.1 4-coumarate--CoA ligase [Coemansia sp. RSA 1721]KAJ2602648.1 4-coumarate--CoA ligase [Coemansia sp. RSA 1722]KAJ2637736.1 4-coumarate--CoA ligase [Coemansia sp. RSA 1286]